MLCNSAVTTQEVSLQIWALWELGFIQLSQSESSRTTAYAATSSSFSFTFNRESNQHLQTVLAYKFPSIVVVAL